MSYTTRKVRPHIAIQAKHMCGYCQLQEVVSGIPLTIEHIIPIARGGTDDEDNLWLSCGLCNGKKGTIVTVIDSKTNQETPLFNPRFQIWKDHFLWDETGTKLIAQSAIGRVTIKALSLNSDLRVRSRSFWVKAGWHPPH